MDKVVIHHPDLRLETEQPESTAKNLAKKGWKAGPLPKKKKES